MARDSGELVFVEVKTRRSLTHALPEDSITNARIEHLEGAIDEYLDQHGTGVPPYRIEVISIQVDRSGRVSRCEILRDVGLR